MESSTTDKGGLLVYEIGYLVLPSIPEDRLEGVVDALRKIISKEGGVEIDGEAPFKRPLAYQISKTIGASRYVLSDAYLGWIKFEVSPESILAIKEGVEKLDEVVRFLLIKAPRETAFTFAKARAIAEENDRKEREAEERKDEKEEPVEPVAVEEAVVN